jgi:hypothetical protein
VSIPVCAEAPGELLQATKTAVSAAARTPVDPARDTMAGRAGGSADIGAQLPNITLRLLPLPPGAELTDPGTGPRPDRTVVVLTGPELLVVPAATAGEAAPTAGERTEPTAVRALAEHIRAALELLAGHCAASTPVYRPDDFPEAGLDDATLARLLDRIGGSQ